MPPLMPHQAVNGSLAQEPARMGACNLLILLARNSRMGLPTNTNLLKGPSEIARNARQREAVKIPRC